MPGEPTFLRLWPLVIDDRPGNINFRTESGDLMNEETRTISKRYLFSGRVQGVGFRWTTNRIAAGFAVTGFVRNLADGRVELVACGQPNEVDAFLQAVNDRLKEYIQAVDEEDAFIDSEEFQDFSIRR